MILFEKKKNNNKKHDTDYMHMHLEHAWTRYTLD